MTTNRKMMDYLPKYYEDSKIVGNIVERESDEFSQLDSYIQDVFNQYFIDTATWGLSYWERILNIKTDESKPYSDRRSLIKSKLRGMGTVTAILIKTVTDSYTNGEVEVTTNVLNYEVIVTFTSMIGRPPNLQDAKDVLREIIPAHLGVTFKLRYLIINEVHNVMTINEIQTRELTDFAPVQPL